MCELQDVNCAIQRTGVVAANQTTIHKLTLKVSYTKITTYMVNANIIFNCRNQTNQQWSGQEQFRSLPLYSQKCGCRFLIFRSLTKLEISANSVALSTE